jgi:hypothetical protein
MNKSFFEFMSLSRAKESLTKTSNDIKQCVNVDVLDCQQQDASRENATLNDYLYIPPFQDVANSSKSIHLEKDHYDYYYY